MESSVNITQILKRERVQSILDQFAEATGIAFVLADSFGRPVTEMSGFTNFCKRMREDERLCEQCYLCDARGGLSATIHGKPYFYRCHASLLDFAVPLFLNSSYMGAVLGGQVKLPSDDDEGNSLEIITKQSEGWRSNPDIVKEYNQINVVPFRKINAVASLMRRMLEYMISEGYKNMESEELNRKRQELAETKKLLLSLEEMLHAGKFLNVEEHYSMDFVFFMLNVISKLAYLEEAPETEGAVCDFSKIIRYLTENGSSRLIPLRKELHYFKCFASILERRSGGNFNYKIEVPHEYDDLLCPFMLFHAIIENLFYSGIDLSQSIEFKVTGNADGDAFILQIESDSITFEESDAKEELPIHAECAQKGKRLLSMIDRRLKNFSDGRYGVFPITQGGAKCGGFTIILPYSGDYTV